jgi:hypothetical protein
VIYSELVRDEKQSAYVRTAYATGSSRRLHGTHNDKALTCCAAVIFPNCSSFISMNEQNYGRSLRAALFMRKRRVLSAQAPPALLYCALCAELRNSVALFPSQQESGGSLLYNVCKYLNASLRCGKLTLCSILCDTLKVLHLAATCANK